MPLIVETGTEVLNANSYVTLEEVRAFALARGFALSATDSIVEIACIKAMDFLESFSNRFKGHKLTGTQGLQFPRGGVSIDGFLLDENVIPLQLKRAQSQLVIEIHSGVDLTPTSDGKFLVRQKVDVIENEWSPASGPVQPNLTKFDMLIAPLLENSTGGLVSSRA